MHCNICGSLSKFIFKKLYLQKHDVSLFQCTNCGFIQTEKPYWLEEAYRLPFTPLDIFLASRPSELSQLTENLILNYFDYTARFVDYGGGVGVFTRMMRDRGLQFYRQDKYAQNLFTQYFDITDLPQEQHHFELATCFEVLEHLEHPLDELSKMFALSDNILCSTSLQPSTSLAELKSWDYIGELHGQHISFYTPEAMKIIAQKFNCNYYSPARKSMHLFTSKSIKNITLSRISKKSIAKKVRNKVMFFTDKIYNDFFRDETDLHPLQSLREKDTSLIIEKLTQKN
jgi:Methyltransferase domain